MMDDGSPTRGADTVLMGDVDTEIVTEEMGETVIGSRTLRPGDTIYELTKVIEEHIEEEPESSEIPEDIINEKVAEAAERIAREMFPSIAERVIREEIEKLKRTDAADSEPS